MLQLTGIVSRIAEREVKPTAGGKQFQPFVETNIVLDTMGHRYYVTQGRDFVGDLPPVGSEVTVEVVPRPYRSGDALRVGWTAVRLLSTGEDAAGRRASSPAA